MLKFILRIALVAAALIYALPHVSGIKFHGDVLSAITTSVVFNVAFVGLEWLLGVLVFGINIGTLGLGVLITGGLRWLAGLMVPSLALYGTYQLFPNFLKIANYFPDTVVGGLILGGLLWVALPEKKKR